MAFKAMYGISAINEVPNPHFSEFHRSGLYPSLQGARQVTHLEQKNPRSTQDDDKPTRHATMFKGSSLLLTQKDRDRQGNHILQFLFSPKSTKTQRTSCLFYLCAISQNNNNPFQVLLTLEVLINLHLLSPLYEMDQTSQTGSL